MERLVPGKDRMCPLEEEASWMLGQREAGTSFSSTIVGLSKCPVDHVALVEVVHATWLSALPCP